MKLTSFTLASVCTLLMVGCGSDDSSSANNNLSTTAALSTTDAKSNMQALGAPAAAQSSSTDGTQNLSNAWNFYRGDVHPAANRAISFADGSSGEFSLTTSTDNFVEGEAGVVLNTLASVETTSSLQLNNIVAGDATYPKYFTFAAGVSAVDAAPRLLEIELAFSQADSLGSRLQVVLHNDKDRQGVEVETASSTASLGLTDMNKHAVYHLSVRLNDANTADVQVFRDGQLMPNLSLTNVTLSPAHQVGDNYLRIGDASSTHAYGAKIDWMAWTNQGAYSPKDAGTSLPGGAATLNLYDEIAQANMAMAYQPNAVAFSTAIRPAQIQGFAAYTNVTGGAGGQVITVTTGAQLNAALCENRATMTTPVTIMVNGTINHANTQAAGCNTLDDTIEIKKMSNVSIIGVGNNALFDEIGIHLREASNIIIQNVHVRNVKKSGSPTSNGGDAIGIESQVDRVWIDHNHLEASGGEKSGYDSLLDMKAGVTNVTVSYNLFNDSSRGGLIGSSDSDNKNTNITFHHNWYKNIEQRTPLIRHALVHMFNNYWSNPSQDYMFHGINSRMNAKALVESNYFYNANNPLIASDDSSVAGCWQTNNDNTVLPSIHYSRTPGNGALVIPAVVNGQLQSTCQVSVPYTVAKDPAASVPAIVMANAGVGKIGNAGQTPSSASSSSRSSAAVSSVRSSAISSSSVRSSVASSSSKSSVASSSLRSSSVASSSSAPSGNTGVWAVNTNVTKTVFFSAAHAAISGNASAPLYHVTGGENAITLSGGNLTLGGGSRFTIGNKPPRAATKSSDSSANGDLNLTGNFRISFQVVSASGSGKFQVYLDNNQTSASASRVGDQSRLFNVNANTLSANQQVVINSSLGSATSFIQLRSESSANVTLRNLRIERL